MKALKNNYGVTLLELLIVLAIGTTLSILVWGVLNNAVKTYDKTAEHINLRQEANILIETLSNRHKREENLDIRYDNQNKKLYINEQLFNDKGYKIDVSFRGSTREDLFDNSYHITNLQNQKLVRLYFKFYDENGSEYEIQTTISRL
ncbi:PulJ/GspJ family protein [Priestia abyssalis]|uniref:PulJ/GspJ family protein n=1 Tax=Priestia abyssalis TaxID=1221450 RepID=UPI00099538DF|nr:type II secretion system protein [Priestia abyssalis]